jgi:hypothetical protein
MSYCFAHRWRILLQHSRVPVARLVLANRSSPGDITSYPIGVETRQKLWKVQKEKMGGLVRFCAHQSLGKSEQFNGRKLHDGLDEREPPDRSRVGKIFWLGWVFYHALSVSKRHFQERQKRKSKQCISNLKLLKLTDGDAIQPPQVLDIAYDTRSASLHQTSEL